jgi:hypothetical protein
MLWTVCHEWAEGSRMAFNSYRHSAILVMLSKEGVTQGCPLAMLLYGVALIPLARSLREAVPEAPQPWYADNLAIGGQGSSIAKTVKLLRELGPRRGYYPEPSKYFIVCDPQHRECLQVILAEFNFRYEDGNRYLGGFIGSSQSKKAWVDEQVAKWVSGIHDLAKVVKRCPHTAYAGLTRSLSMEWTYLQRVVLDLEDRFHPVEKTLVESFIPALFDEPCDDAKMKAMIPLFALPCRNGGLGIPNPQKTAAELKRQGQGMMFTPYCSTPAENG